MTVLLGIKPPMLSISNAMNIIKIEIPYRFLGSVRCAWGRSEVTSAETNNTDNKIMWCINQLCNTLATILVKSLIYWLLSNLYLESSYLSPSQVGMMGCKGQKVEFQKSAEGHSSLHTKRCLGNLAAFLDRGAWGN